MREQVCVTKQRPCRRFSVVTYALAAFRYLATGIVCGAAFGAASGSTDRRAWGSHRCGPEQDIPTSGNRGAVIGTSPEAKAFFFLEGGS